MNLAKLLFILVAVGGSGWYLSCELCALSHQNAHIELLLRQQTSINEMTTDILTEYLNASAANTTAALLELHILEKSAFGLGTVVSEIRNYVKDEIPAIAVALQAPCIIRN
jgi:hypothetical protein